MMKKKFVVYLSAVAAVEARIEVEAEDQKEASEKAVKVAKGGDVAWDYNGVDDGTIEVNEVQDGKT